VKRDFGDRSVAPLKTMPSLWYDETIAGATNQSMAV